MGIHLVIEDMDAILRLPPHGAIAISPLRLSNSSSCTVSIDRRGQAVFVLRSLCEP